MKKVRILFTGGGTGGHLYPLIAVAQNVKELQPGAEILFIGSKTRIEAKAVPAAGFDFKAVTVTGIPRRIGMELIKFPFVFTYSIINALAILMKFRPDAAVGSGAYISAPGIIASKLLGAKIVLLEQNSFPGVTTKLLQRFASEIHISFSETVKYFKDKSKVYHTGNPVRPGMEMHSKADALKSFGLSPEKPALLVLGGSLGAAKINQAIASITPELTSKGIQVIWQAGERYFKEFSHLSGESCKVLPFIDDMGSAYAACSLLVARAGATTIAEIAALGIPSVLVPSPNVANNHQYFNAKSLADGNAAMLLTDDEVDSKLLDCVVKTVNDQSVLSELSDNIRKFSFPEAGRKIAERLFILGGEIR